MVMGCAPLTRRWLWFASVCCTDLSVPHESARTNRRTLKLQTTGNTEGMFDAVLYRCLSTALPVGLLCVTMTSALVTLLWSSLVTFHLQQKQSDN
jgi:hypothetical protein